MGMFTSSKSRELEALRARLAKVEMRSNLLDEVSGTGLWDAYLYNGEIVHEKSIWTWSSEFRRLLGFDDEASFPNRVESLMDRFHPDDIENATSLMAKLLQDRNSRARYNIYYRVKKQDGNYNWFRATGGCKHLPDGNIIACGTLTDVHEEVLLRERAGKEAAEDQITITELSRGLAALAARDLTHRITGAFPAKTAALKDDFNLAADRLQESMGNVVDAIGGMITGSVEISHASNDLSKRTEQQAASLEQTAAALDEITVNVSNSSKRADEARKVASEANSSAALSGNVVGQAVSAMSRIEESSKQISNIIGVIDEIAFQTNLLALNAGVEAARAGDAGKGFAVVAQEVRELAQRSAQAAKEIKGLIQTSTNEVATGVKLVSETGTALKTIEGFIVNINDHMEAIATSAREQSVGLAEVNTAVNQMDQVTQQNAAMVEETNAASNALAEESSNLESIIGQFNLGARSHSSAGKPNPVHALNQTARIMAKPAQGRPAHRAAARPASGSAAVAQEWSEF